MKSHKPALGFIFVTLILDVLGFSILIPVGPRLVQQLLGEGTSDGVATEWSGYLAATYAAMQFLFSPTLGALSDRFGRRPVLLISMFGSGLDYFAMAFAPSLAWFFVFRVINGMSGASMTVANAYIADITTPEKRAAGFGIAGAAIGLGFTIGPLLGGWLGSYDLRWPFLAAGGLTLLNWLYGFFVLPESLPPDRRFSIRARSLNPVRVFRHILENHLVAGLAASLFFANIAMFSLHSTWVMYTKHRYEFGTLGAGLSLFTVGVGGVIIQGFLAKRLIRALGPGVVGERRALLIGAALVVVAYLGYGLATHGWMLYVIISLASLAGIAQPAVQALITRSVHPTEQGATQGALTALGSIAGIMAHFAGPAAFAWGSDPTTPPPWNHPGLSYFISAALATVGGVIAWFATQRILRASQNAGPLATEATVVAEDRSAAATDAPDGATSDGPHHRRT